MGVCEKFASRSITDTETPTAETIWSVWSEPSAPIADEVAAYAALVAHPLPTTYTFPSGRVATLVSITIKDVDEKSWDFTVSYSVFVPKEEDDIEYEFEAGSQSVTLTHATATTAFTGGGRTAPDFRNGINISADGKIQGIAVDRPRFSFSLTKHWAREAVTTSYQLIVADLVGHVNDDVFGGLPAGSVRFLGGRGRPTGNKFPISYQFEYSPNESGVTVGDISSIARTGWQYLDIYNRVISDDTAKKKVEVPHSVYVHTVYEPADFTALGL